MNKKLKLVLFTIMGMRLVTACIAPATRSSNQQGENTTNAPDTLSTLLPKIVSTVDPELDLPLKCGHD